MRAMPWLLLGLLCGLPAGFALGWLLGTYVALLHF